jgi:hypothetical protein
MMFGGVDTYYDYDERQWKIRRLGGGPVRRASLGPEEESGVCVNPDPAHEPAASDAELR